MKKFAAAAACVAFAVWAPAGLAQDDAPHVHAIAMHGDVKYPPDFTHFDYVNPDAPKGGEIVLSAIGTFDSLNPFIIKGTPAIGSGLIYETLLTNSLDEPFTEYGLLAESVQVPEDRSWVAFKLREEARWHDGKPVTVDDVIFSFEALTTKGNPGFRAYYADVVKAEAAGPRTVRFTFKEGIVNRELPLIMGQLTILPKHDFETKAFDETTLEPPIGSGPYRIETLEAGKFIQFRRVQDYWGKDLPVNRGHYNVDAIRYDYYRDATVQVEAFVSHEFDFRAENNSKVWATAYEGPMVQSGVLVKELIPHQIGTGMQGFVFNTRKEKFADPRLRRALAYAFDFEWTNANLFYGQYTRTKSYFSNSELASEGLPEGQELEILEAFRGRVPDEVFTTVFEPPTTNAERTLRTNLKTAQDMLSSAGYQTVDGALIDSSTGKPMTIEFLLVAPAFERIVGPVVQNLKKLGVTADIRIVDSAQYQKRVEDFDFDMVVSGWGQSQSPGNEQRNYWSSATADVVGSRNLAGIKDPAIDELIEQLISAPDRATLVAATRALDRVLLWGHYVIPNWHISGFRLLHWDKFARPEVLPKYGMGFPDTWWIDQAKAETLETRKSQVRQADQGAVEAAEVAAAEPSGEAADTPNEDEAGLSRLVLPLVIVGLAIVAFVTLRRRKSAS